MQINSDSATGYARVCVAGGRLCGEKLMRERERLHATQHYQFQ